jgi:acetyl esterase/lipase
MLALIFGGLSVVLGAFSLLVVVWAVLPTVRYMAWLLALVAGEQGLWFGFAGLVAAGFGITARTGAGGAGAILGLAAFVVSLVPCVQALRVAREGVRLSLGQYLWGKRYRKSQTKPETVTFAEMNGVPLALDIYRPAKWAGEPCPALIIVHGGSWKAGTKSDFPHWNRYFTEQGFIIFDVEYRLEPAPNCRMAVADVQTALAWVSENGPTYGANPERIALFGRSAGGHLALMAAYNPPEGVKPCAVVSLYGPTELVWGYANPARWDVIDGPGVLRRFLGGSPETHRDIYEEMEPGNYLNPDSPPTLLFHGQRDTLVGAFHAEALTERLQKSQVPHRLVLLPWAHHGFDYFFNGWGSQMVRPILRDFLYTYCRKL